MNFFNYTGELTEPVSGRHWDQAQIHRQVAERVRVYQSCGLKPGDRVMVLFGNRLEFFAELLAIWNLGGCVIPVDSRLTPFEVQKLAHTADARFNVIDDDTNPDVVSILPSGSVLDTLASGVSSGDLVATPLSAGVHPRLDDDALILFTSGSTGEPKGVVHTHRSLTARWITLRQSLGLQAYQRTLCVLPTHFGHGLICNCLYPWLNGCHLFIAPPFKPDLIMGLGALIDNHEVTFVSSVPSIWSLALKTAKSPQKNSLQRIHVGSAPLSESMWTQIQSWSGINEVFNAYGITETGSWVAGTTGDTVVPQSGLIGEPWGAVIRVLKTDAPGGTAGAECAAGEAGMVWLNTPALMKGYFNRQDLTDEAVVQGWFKTGDIGYLDDRGRLILKGRERDEINKGGMKVYPADIDEVVQEFAATDDVCAFAYPDDFYRENVGIAIVLSDQSAQSVRELHAWLEAHLAQHKHPERWYLLDEIPRTSRGKINRYLVKQSCDSEKPLDLRKLLRVETSR